jgi:hypothetical protein
MPHSLGANGDDYVGVGWPLREGFASWNFGPLLVDACETGEGKHFVSWE